MDANRFSCSADVLDATAEGRAVVALESTVIAQGLPWPQNLETARNAEAAVRAAGAVPATIAVVDGIIRIGLTDQQLLEISGVAATEGPGTSGGPVVAEGDISTERVPAVGQGQSPRPGPGHRRGRPRGDHGVGHALDRPPGRPRAPRHGHRRPGRRPPGCVGQLRRLDRPRRAGPGGWCPGRLLGDEIDPRRAGDARVARDAGRPGRRLSHRRAARLPDPIGRVAPGAPRRFAGRGRPARAAPIAPWGSPAPSCWRSPCPSRRHWTPSCCERPSPGPSTRPDGSGIAGKPLTPFLLEAIRGATHGLSLRANCALLAANARLAAEVAVELDRPLRSAARRPEVRLDPEPVGRATTRIGSRIGSGRRAVRPRYRRRAGPTGSRPGRRRRTGRRRAGDAAWAGAAFMPGVDGPRSRLLINFSA